VFSAKCGIIIFLSTPIWIDLFFSLCETTYSNKLTFMYYYKFSMAVYEKNLLKMQFLLVKTYELI
jgi:hypothetical protein